MIEEEISYTEPFIASYRDSLARSRDATINQLNQARENQQARIMSQANRAGMLYSNLPARTKIQYDTSTYYPSLAKIQTSYQTGLDSLREKGVNLANQIKSYQEAIADMDYYTNLYRTR